MAKDTRLTNLVATIQADALGALLNGGYIDILDGTRPATSDTPIAGQVVGVTLQLGTPAFAPAVDGILTANAIAPGVIINAISPATWGRVYKSDHVTAVLDISVGTNNANLLVATVVFTPGVTVQCLGWVHNVIKAAPGY